MSAAQGQGFSGHGVSGATVQNAERFLPLGTTPDIYIYVQKKVHWGQGQTYKKARWGRFSGGWLTMQAVYHRRKQNEASNVMAYLVICLVRIHRQFIYIVELAVYHRRTTPGKSCSKEGNNATGLT